MGSIPSPVMQLEEEYRDVAGQKLPNRSYMASSKKVSDPKVKLMSSFGGKILPRPSDNKLRYAGGDTRMISVSRFIRFNDLEAKMNEIYGPNLTIKYQLPEEDLDALVTVSSDEDLENMMDEYDRLDIAEGASRLRLFVFASADGDSIDLNEIADPRISEQQYVDAVNALQVDTPLRRNGDMLSATSSKNLDDLLHGWDPLPVHDLSVSSLGEALSRQQSNSSGFFPNWHANSHIIHASEATRDHSEAILKKLSDMHVFASDRNVNNFMAAAGRDDPSEPLSKKVSNLPEFASDWHANSPTSVAIRRNHLEALSRMRSGSPDFASSRHTNDQLGSLTKNLSDSPKSAANWNANTNILGTIGSNKVLSRQQSGSSEFASNLRANTTSVSPVGGTFREDPLEALSRNRPDSPVLASNWHANANALPIGGTIGSDQALLRQRSDSSEVSSNWHPNTNVFPFGGVIREDPSEILSRQLSGPSAVSSNWHANTNVLPVTKVTREDHSGALTREFSGSYEVASNWNASTNAIPTTKVTREDLVEVLTRQLSGSSESNLHANANENRDIFPSGAVIGVNFLDRESGGSATSSTSSQYGLHYSPSLHQWNPSQQLQPLADSVSYGNGKNILNKSELGHIANPVGQVPTVGSREYVLDMSAILPKRTTNMHMKVGTIPIVDEEDKVYLDVPEAIPLSPGAILQKQLEIDRNQNQVISKEVLQSLAGKVEEVNVQPMANSCTQIDSSASLHLIPDLLSTPSTQMDHLLSTFTPIATTGSALSSSAAGEKDMSEMLDLFPQKTDIEKTFSPIGYTSGLHTPVASGTLEQEPINQGLPAKIPSTHNQAHGLAEYSLAYATDNTINPNYTIQNTSAVRGNLQTPQLAAHYVLNDKGLDLNKVPPNISPALDGTLENSDVAPILEESVIAMPFLSKVDGSNLSLPRRMDPDENVAVPSTKLDSYAFGTGDYSRTDVALVASQLDQSMVRLSKLGNLSDLSSAGFREDTSVTAERMKDEASTKGPEEVECSGCADEIHEETEMIVGGDEEDKPVAREERLPHLPIHAPASMIDVWSTTRSQYEQDVTAPPANHLEDVDERSDTEETEVFQSAVGTISNTVVKPKKIAATAGKDPLALNLQTILYCDLEELRELGSGTFGTVYHGKWRGTDVAIKKIKSTCFTGRPSERDRLIADFWQEASILGQLHHPNVVAFYGIVPHGPDGTLATVTEFMVNGSLKQALQKKDRILDRRKRLLIAMDAAFGMEYLHGKNIVHFDLKCDNLLVNLRDIHRPICKVGDLGLSKIKQQTMISGGVRGTLPWMAPELLNGSSSLVSEKVDVFSFGIVLWEILTGEEPYADMHYGAIIGGIVSNTLRPPVPRWCDATYRTLMEACWSADPSERPTFSEIARSLRSMEAALAAKGRAQSPISGQD